MADEDIQGERIGEMALHHDCRAHDNPDRPAHPRVCDACCCDVRR